MKCHEIDMQNNNSEEQLYIQIVKMLKNNPGFEEFFRAYKLCLKIKRYKDVEDISIMCKKEVDKYIDSQKVKPSKIVNKLRISLFAFFVGMPLFILGILFLPDTPTLIIGAFAIVTPCYFAALYFQEKNRWSDYLYALEMLENYMNSDNMRDEINAVESFRIVGDYKDSKKLLKMLQEDKYVNAVYLFDSGNYREAQIAFRGLEGFEDSEEYIKKIRAKE